MGHYDLVFQPIKLHVKDALEFHLGRPVSRATVYRVISRVTKAAFDGNIRDLWVISDFLNDWPIPPEQLPSRQQLDRWLEE